MKLYRLQAVNAEGHGETYGWGDTYEVEEASYADAKANVLGRLGSVGELFYVKIVNAWAKEDWRWVPLDPENGENLA